ncbi:MAG: hypothetical protein KJ624_08275 [Chloroflexi bacterium]|nr:hypothetical protein [Chloroflexota bacterium]
MTIEQVTLIHPENTDWAMLADGMWTLVNAGTPYRQGSLLARGVDQ